MKCPICNSELKQVHSDTISNVEYENVKSCANKDCDYTEECICGVTRWFKNDKWNY